MTGRGAPTSRRVYCCRVGVDVGVLRNPPVAGGWPALTGSPRRYIYHGGGLRKVRGRTHGLGDSDNKHGGGAPLRMFGRNGVRGRTGSSLGGKLGADPHHARGDLRRHVRTSILEGGVFAHGGIRNPSHLPKEAPELGP